MIAKRILSRFAHARLDVIDGGEAPEDPWQEDVWLDMLERPAVGAYLTALNAWLEAGAEDAPACVTGLKRATLVDLLDSAESVEDIAA